MGYICGFNGNKPLRRLIEKVRKEKRNFLINKGINDAKIWFKAGRRVISQVDDDIYPQEKKELRLIELFK